MTRFRFLLTVIFGLFITLSTSAFADEWIHTGDAMRTKSIGPFSVKVYAIRHDMKARPAQKSKQAIIDADVDKKFTWTMMRDVDSPKIQNALREAFALNGFGDGARIGRFVSAFSKAEVKEKSAVVITYNAAAKSTTIWVQDGSSVTVAGEDFMKAVWSLWFGKIDPSSISDQLMSKL